MYVNEYEMTWQKYVKWTVPKFYTLPIFYVYMFILIVSIVSLKYFDIFNIETRWKTLAAFLIFIAIYRGIFFKYLRAIKQFVAIKDKQFGKDKWMCKTEILDDVIVLYLNNRENNRVSFDKIKKVSIAKTYIALKSENEFEKIIIDKNSFTKGNAEDFINDLKLKHKKLIFENENIKYDR